MAIGWLAVLQNIPWTDVVSKAPVVTDGARKLWNAVAKKSTPPLIERADVKAIVSPEARAIAALEEKVSALEVAAFDLQNQMVASSELIKALADQNTQLIHRIETMRLRLLWLLGALSLVGVIAATGLALILMR